MDLQSKFTSNNSQLGQQYSSSVPTISEYVSNISRQSSVSSNKSSCSGVIVNGRLHCCHEFEGNFIQKYNLVTKQKQITVTVNKNNTQNVKSTTVNDETLVDGNKFKGFMNGMYTETIPSVHQDIKNPQSDVNQNNENFEPLSVVITKF